jgi:hypothetical protein
MIRFLFAALVFILISGCKEENEKVFLEEFLRQQEGSWEVDLVNFNGSPLEEFDDFVLTFSMNGSKLNQGTYLVSGLPSPVYFPDPFWRETGIWEVIPRSHYYQPFRSNNALYFFIDENEEVEITSRLDSGEDNETKRLILMYTYKPKSNRASVPDSGFTYLWELILKRQD